MKCMVNFWVGGEASSVCMTKYCSVDFKTRLMYFCLVNFGKFKIHIYFHQQSWKILLFGAINLICIGFLLMWCSSTNSIGRWLLCTETTTNYHVFLSL